ncbi:MAG: phage terminase large subunit [Alphaproteobacteria bacterium]|nr:phage terminase large subunit [Alphaproteobacteria bacterium]
MTFLEFLWIWDKLNGLKLPQHHKVIGHFLEKLFTSENERKGLLMAFRNSGKSTLVGLFCAWILLKNPNLRVLVVSADHELAKKMVMHTKHIIEHHPACFGMKPVRPQEWASDRFTVRRSTVGRDPSVLARGLNANITGCRADIILCDDVEVPKTCNNSAKRKDLRTKLSELDYILIPGGMMLYIGTPHAEETIYRPKTGWQLLKLPLLNKAGESVWPERFTPKKIAEIRRATSPNKFASQMLLENVKYEESRLDIKHLKIYDLPLSYQEANGSGILKIGQTKMVSASCWWDPAFGKVGGDASVIGVVFTGEDGNYYLHDLRYLQVPEGAGSARWQCEQVARFIWDNYLPAVHLETNGIGQFLPALLRQEFARHRMGCSVVEENSRQNKAQRILGALEVPLLNGSLYAHALVMKTPFPDEMQDFNTTGHTHDDGLDTVAGCILCEPVRLPGIITFNRNRPLWRY